MSKITISKLHDLYKLAQQQAKEINLPIGDISPNITVTKAKSYWGICRTQYVKGKKVHIIEVSEQLLYANDKEILETICHELIHTCDGCDNHGKLWQSYAAKFNRKYGYNIKRTSSAEEKDVTLDMEKNAKYCIECLKCGNKIYAYKMSNVVKCPQAFRCKCGGTLKRIK